MISLPAFVRKVESTTQSIEKLKPGQMLFLENVLPQK